MSDSIPEYILRDILKDVLNEGRVRASNKVGMDKDAAYLDKQMAVLRLFGLENPGDNNELP